MNCDDKKNFQQIVSSIVKKYFSGRYEQDLSIFPTLTEQLSNIELTVQDNLERQQLMRLFFLGQIVGLPNLHSILERFEIKSNNRQIKYKRLCKKLSNNKLHEIFEFIFEQQLIPVLDNLVQKDASNWSREFKNKGFGTLRMFLQSDKEILDNLKKTYLNTFCKQKRADRIGNQRVRVKLITTS